eukprot:729772-Prymnesium_polylepis.1
MRFPPPRAHCLRSLTVLRRRLAACRHLARPWKEDGRRARGAGTFAERRPERRLCGARGKFESRASDRAGEQVFLCAAAGPRPPNSRRADVRVQRDRIVPAQAAGSVHHRPGGRHRSQQVCCLHA